MAVEFEAKVININYYSNCPYKQIVTSAVIELGRDVPSRYDEDYQLRIGDHIIDSAKPIHYNGIPDNIVLTLVYCQRKWETQPRTYIPWSDYSASRFRFFSKSPKGIEKPPCPPSPSASYQSLSSSMINFIPDLSVNGEFMDDSIPVNQPMDDSIPVNQPMDDSIPVNQPMDDSIPVNQPMDDLIPVNQPMDNSIPVNQPAPPLKESVGRSRPTQAPNATADQHISPTPSFDDSRSYYSTLVGSVGFSPSNPYLLDSVPEFSMSLIRPESTDPVVPVSSDSFHRIPDFPEGTVNLHRGRVGPDSHQGPGSRRMEERQADRDSRV